MEYYKYHMNVSQQKDVKILVKDETGKFSYLEGDFLSSPSAVPAVNVQQKQQGYVIPYEAIARDIQNTLSLVFGDEQDKKKFYSYVISRLRDIRSSYQLRELLTRPKESGGIGLSEKIADHAVQVIEEKARSVQQNTQRRREGVLDAHGQEPSFVKAIAQRQRGDVLHDMSFDSVKDVPLVSPPLHEEKIDIRKGGAVEKEHHMQMRSPVQILKEQQIRPSFIHEDQGGRPHVSDIKMPVRVMGPVEEIRSMTLEEFRQLASVGEIVEKIQDKIALLEEESFSKKAEGVAAWKESEPNQLYLDIGNESMGRGVSVLEVIEQRMRTKRVTLTQEEFDAISDINSALRFS